MKNYEHIVAAFINLSILAFLLKKLFLFLICVKCQWQYFVLI